MSDKTVRVLGASVEEVMDNGRSTRTGNVRLNVVLEWLKNRPVARASLTPAEARHVAIRLLLAAENAEGRR